MQFFVNVNRPTWIWLILVVAFLANRPAAAQLPEFYWKHFNINNGLPSLDIRCLKQDSRGLLWIGTADGLVCYDGNHFVSITLPHPGTPSTDDNVIIRIEEDQYGDMFFCTNRGIVILHRNSGHAERKEFSLPDTDPKLLNIITGILFWGGDSLWAATHAGTLSWNRKTGAVQHMGPAFDLEINGEDNPFIRHPLREAFYMLLRGKPGRYDLKTAQLTNLPTLFDRTDIDYAQRDLAGFAMGPDGVLWYASISDSALYAYDTNSGAEKEHKMIRHVGGVSEPVYVISIAADSQGRIWITSWNEFPLVFDPRTETWTKIRFRVNDPFGMPHGAMRALVQTTSGEMWVAHSNGLSVHSPVMEAGMKLPVPGFTDDQESPWYGVLCLWEDAGSGELYAGTNQLGLIVYDTSLSHFNVHSVVKGDYRANTILSLIQTGKDVWCGTAKGLYKFHPKDQTFALFDPFKDGIFHQAGIYQMGKIGNTVWFNCRGSRVYGYDIRTGATIILPAPTGDDRSMLNEYSPYMIVTTDGQLCFGHNKGYSFMNPETGIFRHFILYPEPLEAGNQAVAGLIEAFGSIWYLPRGDGLFKINPKSGASHRVFGRSSLGNLYGLHAADGKLWFGSSKGIALADTTDYRIRLFRYDNAVFPTRTYLSAYSLQNGKSVFFINHNLLVVDPGFHDRILPISPPLVASVISGGPVLPVLDGNIQLDSDHNYVTIRYSSLSDAGRDDIEYAIMLEGWDRERAEVGQQTSAAYNNLRGGTYTFRVWAKSKDGPWVECAKPLVMHIEKTFPETLGFKVLMFAVLAGILWLIIRLRKRVERRLKREKAIRHFTTFSDDRNPDDLARDIVTTATETLRFQAAAIYSRDEKMNQFRQVSRTTNEKQQEEPTIFPAEIPLPEPGETYEPNTTDIPIVHKGDTLAILRVMRHPKAAEWQHDLNALREIAAVCADKFAAARAQEEVKRKEQLLARINALLAESQLASLRAQMNPHFVFNCLNSIQESIIMKNYAEASHYLNKFSKLFRQVLQNSSRSLIPLSEEISVLRLYLELEHMRFQGAFHYHISVDETMEADEIMIPSMLLQPFVENSLWHGLMHKESDRQLHLRFYPKNEEVFACEIEDNGIGREKAAEIKKQKAGTGKHHSRGIGIAMDRLRLIRLQQGQHATIDIKDLRDADGQASGTLVVCELSSFLHQLPNP